MFKIVISTSCLKEKDFAEIKIIFQYFAEHLNAVLNALTLLILKI